MDEFPRQFMPGIMPQNLLGDGKSICQEPLNIVVEKIEIDLHAAGFDIRRPWVGFRIANVGGKLDLSLPKTRQVATPTRHAARLYGTESPAPDRSPQAIQAWVGS